MTDEQLKAKRERVRILEGKFLTYEHVKKFLHEQGYNWQGVYTENEDRNYGSFWHSISNCTSIRDIFIFIGEKENLPKAMEQYNGALVGNPYIKFLSNSLMSFKLFVPKINPCANDIICEDDDEPTIVFELEKDLTKEWIKFLLLNVPEYEIFVKEKIKYAKTEIPERIRCRKSLLAQKIEMLKREQEALIESQEKEDKQDLQSLSDFQELEEYIQQIKEDNEKTT